jgi:hypothetical protein
MDAEPLTEIEQAAVGPAPGIAPGPMRPRQARVAHERESWVSYLLGRSSFVMQVCCICLSFLIASKV